MASLQPIFSLIDVHNRMQLIKKNYSTLTAARNNGWRTEMYSKLFYTAKLHNIMMIYHDDNDFKEKKKTRNGQETQHNASSYTNHAQKIYDSFHDP